MKVKCRKSIAHRNSFKNRTEVNKIVDSKIDYNNFYDRVHWNISHKSKDKERKVNLEKGWRPNYIIIDEKQKKPDIHLLSDDLKCIQKFIKKNAVNHNKTQSDSFKFRNQVDKYFGIRKGIKTTTRRSCDMAKSYKNKLSLIKKSKLINHTKLLSENQSATQSPGRRLIFYKGKSNFKSADEKEGHQLIVLILII